MTPRSSLLLRLRGLLLVGLALLAAAPALALDEDAQTYLQGFLHALRTPGGLAPGSVPLQLVPPPMATP